MIKLNPFPGLRPFREGEEHLFFGRETQVDTMIDKLWATRFLAVVGVSGSGKSSLVNCGLRPALHRGLMAQAGTAWRVAQFRPGNNPIRAMAEAIAAAGVLNPGVRKGRFSAVDIVETSLRMSKAGLLDVYESSQLGEGTNLLLVADQFEELFRYRELARPQIVKEPDGGQEATAFVNLLLQVRDERSLPIYVVLTMRSDFLGDCAQFFGLPEAINQGQYLVPRLTRDERRLAIAGPTAIGGAEITPVLLTRLVNDVGENPDQLSILQHALNRTWARWEDVGERRGPIELDHYEAIGTMTHALDQHAEAAYAQLTTERQRVTCGKIFKALTDQSTDPRGIRRPTRMDTLCALTGASDAELTAVIDVFRESSRAFLMPPMGEPLRPDTVVDISHESLMRTWSRLKRWAGEEALSAQMYRRLAETATLHEAGQSGLWRDPDLQLALNWYEQNRPNTTWAEQYRPGFELAERFLRLSERNRSEERRAVRRKRVSLLALLGALVVALAVSSFGYVQQRQTAATLELERKLRKEAVTARDEALQAERLANERTNTLLAQFGWDRENLTRASSDPHAVRQSLSANQALQQAASLGGRDRRRTVTVEYFPKNVDQNKVEGALMELGFTVRTPPAIVRNIPTNAIWFGTPVNIEDVKLVALTLIRAGVEIKAIRLIQDYIVSKKDALLIQVGADSSLVNDPALTVESIRAAKAFTRDR